MKPGEGKYQPTVLTKRDGTPIPADEPWFALRGQDRFTLPVLHRYRELCDRGGCSLEHLAGIDERILAITTFQVEHPDRIKLPGP